MFLLKAVAFNRNYSVRRAIRGGASAEAPLRIARECRGDALIARVKRICGLNSYDLRKVLFM